MTRLATRWRASDPSPVADRCRAAQLARLLRRTRAARDLDAICVRRGAVGGARVALFRPASPSVPPEPSLVAHRGGGWGADGHLDPPLVRLALRYLSRSACGYIGAAFAAQRGRFFPACPRCTDRGDRELRGSAVSRLAARFGARLSAADPGAA